MSEQTLQENLREWAEIERITDAKSDFAECAIKAADRIDQLERQLAEAREDRADAKRYRWLRDDSIHTDFEAPLVHIFDAENNNLEILNDKKLDQAIDAAIQKVKT